MPRRRKIDETDAPVGEKIALRIAEIEREAAAVDRQIEGLQRKKGELVTEGQELRAARDVLERFARRKPGRPPGKQAKANPVSAPESRGPVRPSGTPQGTRTTIPFPLPAADSFTTIRGLITALAVAMPGPFQPPQISDILKEHYPEVYKKMPPGYVSSSLWFLANGKKKNKPIRMVDSEGPGGMNTYISLKVDAAESHRS